MNDPYKQLMNSIGYRRGYPDLSDEEVVKLLEKVEQFTVQQVEEIIKER